MVNFTDVYLINTAWCCDTLLHIEVYAYVDREWKDEIMEARLVNDKYGGRNIIIFNNNYVMLK